MQNDSKIADDRIRLSKDFVNIIQFTISVIKQNQ